MHEIFSTENLPKRRLVLSATLTNRGNDVGREIIALRERLARELVQKCVNDKDLVKMTPNGQIIELRADCIVLTSDELADLMREQFLAGLQHASGFMPFTSSKPNGEGV